MNVFKLTIFFFATIFAGLLLQPPSNVLAQRTDEAIFLEDVSPIIQSRCVACHNADRSEGDLRFDGNREALESGGHTGRSILGTSSDDSELIRRIKSTKIGYRMPKKGPPLNENQIATLIRWVDAGAVWGDPSEAIRKTEALQEAAPIVTLADRVVWLNQQMERPGFRRLVYLSLVFFVAIIGLFWWQKRSYSNSNDSNNLRTSNLISGLKTIAIVVLAFLCVAIYIHFDAKHKEALEQTHATEAKLKAYTGPDDFLHSLTAPYPMHPPRLGGVYYRGNDERDAQLFNGGFYRTAKFEIWLTDEEGRKFQWGDKPTGKLFVEFEIQRAANTTGELFNDYIMSIIGISSDFILNDEPDGPARVINFTAMQTVEADQRWRCRFPIGDLTMQQKLSGKLFVVQNTSKPKAHYAIEFEIIRDDDGTLAKSSQLWMGSLYNLNGRVFVPYNNQKLLLDRWFDWRPIPEVVGEQTDDPKLLGIPEHQ